MAERVLGVVARVRSDMAEARSHLERALATAVSAGLPTRAAEARTSLALVLFYVGDTGEALCQLDLAEPALRGRDAARLQSQRALILARLGRSEEALDGFRAALAATRRCGDLEGEARLLTNRGILYAYRGQFRAAEADLARAERQHAELGQLLDAADVRHNLGFVAARRGDIPAALRWYDQAERQRATLGIARPAALVDRCETLLAARLVAEARAVGAGAACQLEANGLQSDLAEVRLLLAQAALLDGDVEEARQLGRAARRAFTRQHRPGWAALARYTLVRVEETATRGRPRVIGQLDDVVAELVQAGWVGPALDGRLIAACLDVEHGRLDEAGARLASTVGARRWAPAELRARVWYAEAQLRRARGDGRATDAALRAGVRALAQSRATLGATELRVHAAGKGEDLAALAVRAALETGDARRVLAWAERCRAACTLMRPARPPGDEELAASLDELRHLVATLEDTGFEGRDTARLLRRRAGLEAEIRRRSRHAVGDDPAAGAHPPSASELGASLGARVLLELVESDGLLHGVTVAGGRARAHRLGAVAAVRAETEALRFGLARLARDNLAEASRSAAVELVAAAAGRLDRLVLEPVRSVLGDRPLVIVPTGVLHAVPWAALPTCRDRAVSVCPSAAVWLRTACGGPPPPPGAALLIAGPDVPHAAAEVADLAGVHPRATTLVGPEATIAAFTEASAGADLVHVAAHGRFRVDNPLFSAVRLADGPLTVYDLEAMPSPPRRLILSACDAGLSSVSPGDELMGFSSALFALGGQVLVASVVAVRDVTTRRLMQSLHRGLARGMPAPEALARAHGEARLDSDGGLASAGFVCFGA